MKILILGSEGFIGKHCVNYFVNKGEQVFGVDLMNEPSTNYIFIQRTKDSNFYSSVFREKFDVVINCAGSGNVSFSMQNPLFDFEMNCFETIKILDELKKYSNTKYIHLSSAAVYGNPTIKPITESTALSPVSPYGYHKMIAEQICKEFFTMFNCKIAILRPFSVYGPGLKKQMFWDWNQKTISNNQEIELFGTGNESRDYIYINDLVRSLAVIIDHSSFDLDVYNVASGSETLIKDAAKIFFSSREEKINYKFNDIVRSGDPLNWKADISKLKSLGFELVFSLEQGISDLKTWLKTQK